MIFFCKPENNNLLKNSETKQVKVMSKREERRNLVVRSPGKALFQPLKANTVLMCNDTFPFLWSGFPLVKVSVQLSGKEKKLIFSEQCFLAFCCSFILGVCTEVYK